MATAAGVTPAKAMTSRCEVRLVDVAALCRYQGGVVADGKAVRRVVETDQPGGPLGGEADLGPEPGPQTFAAPSDLRGQPLDPNPTAVLHHLPPGEGDLRVDRPTRLVPSGERGPGDREPVPP